MPYNARHEWIHPLDVDWTDGLNPIRIPGFTRMNDPYAYASLQDPYNLALRLGKGIEPRIYVCPEPAQQVIEVGATVDFEVPAEPNTWLWGINTSSRQVDGENKYGEFLFNVYDSVTGSQLFSQMASGLQFNFNWPGQGPEKTDRERGPVAILPSPHMYNPPSYPVVRIMNTGAFQQVCRVNLFTCVEYVTS